MTCGISVLMVVLGTWQMPVSSNLLLLGPGGNTAGQREQLGVGGSIL